MATIYSEFLDIEPDEFRRATDVTYHGLVWGTRAALRRMKERNHGTIVQVGSALAFRGIPLQAPYCGAKARRQELHRVGYHGDQAQRLGRPHLDGSHRRVQHDAVHVGTDEAAEPDAAGAADLPAGGRRRRDPLGCAPPAQAVYVGLPTVLNLVGEYVAPGFLDWYLAKTATARR